MAYIGVTLADDDKEIVRPPYVESALQRLSASIETLDEHMRRLIDRISPICSDAASETKVWPAEQGHNVYLADRIDAIAQHVECLTDAVQNAYDRVEL